MVSYKIITHRHLAFFCITIMNNKQMTLCYSNGNKIVILGVGGSSVHVLLSLVNE